MSMHLHHPSLSYSGKKKGKQKFRNAAEAQRARELDASWNELQKRWGVQGSTPKKKPVENWVPPQTQHRCSTDAKIPSLDTGAVPCTKAPDKVYTGDKIIGIGTMHKSNAVPIFSNEQAKDISSMRR